MDLKEESLIIFVTVFMLVFVVHLVIDYLVHKTINPWISGSMAFSFALLVALFDYFRIKYYDERKYNLDAIGHNILTEYGLKEEAKHEGKTPEFKTNEKKEEFKAIHNWHWPIHWKSPWNWFIFIGVVSIIFVILIRIFA